MEMPQDEVEMPTLWEAGVRDDGAGAGDGPVGTPSFGEMVRQLVAAQGRSVDWLARAIGEEPSTFRNYTSGRRKVPLDIVLRVANTLRVRPDPLMRAAGFGPETGRAALALAPGSTLLVPVVGVVPASPGERMNTSETVPYIPYSPNARPENLVALRVVGDCLSPDVQPGDVVIIDTSLEPVDGRLGVVVVDNAYTLKRVRRRDDGWHLESNTGPLVPIEAAEWFGRVVFSGRPHI